MSLQDGLFSDDVENDLILFSKDERRKRVLVFPPVNNYRRFLIHQLVQDRFANLLYTFSIGQGFARRTVVCFKTDVIRDPKLNVSTSKTSGDTKFGAMGVQEECSLSSTPEISAQKQRQVKTTPAVEIYRPPAARRKRSEPVASESMTNQTVQDSCASTKSTRQKRPDRAVYVPRHRRSLEVEGSPVRQEKTRLDRHKETDSPINIAKSSQNSSLNISTNNERLNLETLSKLSATCDSLETQQLETADCSKLDYSTNLENSQSSNSTNYTFNSSEINYNPPSTENLLLEADDGSNSDSSKNPGESLKRSGDSSKISDESSKRFDDCSKRSDDSSKRFDDCSKISDDSSKRFDECSKISDDSSKKFDDCSKVSDDSSKRFDDCSKMSDDSSKRFDDCSKRFDCSKMSDDSSKRSEDSSNTFNASSKISAALLEPKIDFDADIKVEENNGVRESKSEPEGVKNNSETTIENNSVFKIIEENCDIEMSPKQNRQTIEDEASRREIVVNQKNKRAVRNHSDVLIISDSRNREDLIKKEVSVVSITPPEKKVKKIERSKSKPAAPPSPPIKLNRDDCDWDSLFDDNGDCLDPTLINELSTAVGEVTIEQPKNNYKSYTRTIEVSSDEYAHVVEIYNFPSEFKTCDLVAVFSPFKSGGFELKWVDDTHCLGVFSSPLVAAEVLASDHPFVKTRPLSEATALSKTKARRSSEFLQPFRNRPETCAALARRLVTGALGVKLATARQEREREKVVLREAKEKKKLANKQRDDAWEGVIAEK